MESAVDPTRSQNITVSWRRSASGAAAGATGAATGNSRSMTGAGGRSASRKAGSGWDNAVPSGRARRPSEAKTSRSPSTSAATRLIPISSLRSSSRPSSSRAKLSLIRAVGDAALGDEAPDDLFQDLLKVHASAPVAAAFALALGRSISRRALSSVTRQQCRSRASGHIETNQSLTLWSYR